MVCAVSLILIWLGYPIVMVALAALWPRRRRNAWNALPRVTFIVATREQPDDVRARIDNILASDYDPSLIEVVVALDAKMSVAARAEHRAGDRRVRIVDGDAPGGKAASLNAAVRAARGEILIFGDTFQRFDRQTARLLVDALADPGVGAASGRLELPPARGVASLFRAYWAMEVRLRRAEAVVHSTVGVTGAVWAMRRALWRPLPTGLLLDDVHTPMRLVLEHHRIDFVDEARARELRVGGSDQEVRRKIRTLTGVMQLCAWLPGVLSVRNPVLCQFAAHKLLRLASPYLMIGILPWTLGAAARAGATYPRVLVGVAGSALVVHALTRGRTTRRCWNAVRAAAMVQMAVARATINGFRGQWDVW
jgi:cellulose synthase/poly-beta-1,6-N-acetylglucosamine synthase-like glycosyltransferase